MKSDRIHDANVYEIVDVQVEGEGESFILNIGSAGRLFTSGYDHHFRLPDWMAKNLVKLLSEALEAQ